MNVQVQFMLFLEDLICYKKGKEIVVWRKRCLLDTNTLEEFVLAFDLELDEASHSEDVTSL